VGCGGDGNEISRSLSSTVEAYLKHFESLLDSLLQVVQVTETKLQPQLSLGILKVKVSVGLQRSCILFYILILDPNRFNLAIRGC
jgi:hypothetical protein